MIVLLQLVGLVAALLLYVQTFSAGPMPTDAATAVATILSAIALEVPAAQLAGGYFSAAAPWGMVLASLPGVGLPWALLCVGGAIAVRLAWRSNSLSQFVSYWLSEFWPAALCAWASVRFELVSAVTVYLGASMVLPLVTVALFEPPVRVGKTRNELIPEHVAMVSLGPLGILLIQRSPWLVLLLWPAFFALMRGARTLDELRVQRQFRSKVEQAQKDLSTTSNRLGQTAAIQATMQRTLDARADAFALLEGLAARPVSERQALDDALQALKLRLPGAEWLFFPSSEDAVELTPELAAMPARVREVLRTVVRSGEPWVENERERSEAAWNVLGRGVAFLRSPAPIRPEMVQALSVFFRYLGVALDRVRFQETILKALETEARLRGELDLSVQRLRALLDASADLSVMVDPAQILDFALQQARRWSHGRPCFARHAAFSVGEPAPNALRFPLPEGELLVDDFEMEDSEREALQLWAILVHGSLERCRSQTVLAQSSKLAAIGQLAAGVAHELNTPLGAINISLGMALKSVTTAPEKAMARIEKAKKSVDQTRHIVSKLLNFARESTNSRETLDLSAAVQDAIHIVEHSFKLEGVELRSQLEPVSVNANSSEVQQVVVNLLVNARQACSGKDAACVSVRCFAEGDEACIEVSDNGEGVPQEVIERIFEPFFTTKDVGHGLGLGLSLSRELAVSHGGDLTYQASPSGGACFRLCLPLAAED